jgi:serine/threonine protein kinase
MTQIENLPYIGISKITSERSSVLLVRDQEKSCQYILKRFPINYAGKMQYESEKLIQSFSHPYIIKIKETYDKIQGVVIEHAPHGDFCNLLMSGTNLPELISRTYFHHLIEGIEYLHKNGVAHLDLKLDNLLLGANKCMKIIDFDLSQRIEDEKRSYARGKGTTNYRAPEIRARKCGNYKAADVYSMGVILFALVTGLPPYTESETGECDGWYLLMTKQQDSYWAKIAKYVSVTDEFKELFSGMVSEQPEQRLTINKIRASKWYKGPVLSDLELEQEMLKIVKTQK